MALYVYHPSFIRSYLRENSKSQAVENRIQHEQKFFATLKG